jgi:hypothetical protein
MTEGMPQLLDMSEADEFLRGFLAQIAAGTPSGDETKRWIERAHKVLISLQHVSLPELGEGAEVEWIGFRHESGIMVCGQDVTVQAEWDKQGPTRFVVDTPAGSWHIAWGPDGVRFVETGKGGELGLYLCVTSEGHVRSGKELLDENGKGLYDVLIEKLGKFNWKDEKEVQNLEELPPSARSKPQVRSGTRIVEAGEPPGSEEEQSDTTTVEINKLCPECGADRQEEAEFCVACGVHSKTSQPENCPRCHSKLVAKAVFCPQCGFCIEDSILETETPSAETVTLDTDTKWVEVPQQEEVIENEGPEAGSLGEEEGFETLGSIEGHVDLDHVATYEETDDEYPDPEPEAKETLKIVENDPLAKPVIDSQKTPEAAEVIGEHSSSHSEEFLCPECMAPRKQGKKFCANCGHLYEEDTDDRTPVDVCAGCGAKLKEGSSFCTKCGIRADSKQSPPESAPPPSEKPSSAPEFDDESPPPPPPLPSEGATTTADPQTVPPPDEATLCPACGTPRKQGKSFCVGCGHKFSQNLNTMPKTPSEQLCPNPKCAQKVPVNKKFCTACGTRID